jgi:hypothetical protein
LNETPKSLGRRDGLGLRADPPARELEKFFALGTEIPSLRRDDILNKSQKLKIKNKNDRLKSKDSRKRWAYCSAIS